MGDIAQVATNVHVAGLNTIVLKAQFGEAVTAGMPVYKQAADGKYYKGHRVTSAATAAAIGIVIDEGDGGIDDWGVIATTGDVDLGTASALTIGQPYVLSDDGGISLPADLLGSDIVTHLGYAITTDVLRVAIVSNIVTL